MTCRPPHPEPLPGSRSQGTVRAVPDVRGGAGRPFLSSHRTTPPEPGETMNSVHDSMTRQGLTRPQQGRLLGGVCAGLGRRFGLDPWIARLLFVVVLFVIPGSQILIYPVLWLLMPSEATVYSPPTPPAPPTTW